MIKRPNIKKFDGEDFILDTTCMIDELEKLKDRARTVWKADGYRYRIHSHYSTFMNETIFSLYREIKT